MRMFSEVGGGRTLAGLGGLDNTVVSSWSPVAFTASPFEPIAAVPESGDPAPCLRAPSDWLDFTTALLLFFSLFLSLSVLCSCSFSGNFLKGPNSRRPLEGVTGGDDVSGSALGLDCVGMVTGSAITVVTGRFCLVMVTTSTF